MPQNSTVEASTSAFRVDVGKKKTTEQQTAKQKVQMCCGRYNCKNITAQQKSVQQNTVLHIDVCTKRSLHSEQLLQSYLLDSDQIL